jgi:hypothetical protein
VTKANLDARTIPDADIQGDFNRIPAFLRRKGADIETIGSGLRADLDRVHARYSRVLQALADERDHIDDVC